MARVHGVYLRKPPKGPSAYTSKEAALAASPTMVVADAAFPKNKMESVKNAAFRVNSGGRGDWSPGEFFAVWEYAQDVVLRIRKKAGTEGAVEVIGFVKDGEVIGPNEETVGSLETVLKEEGAEVGGWVLLVGVHPHVPEGWEEIVSAPGSRKRRKD
ncbi:hypothetical protein SEA_SATIS_237 [Streptomyces phage Satis]|nr:hypothetical protein SEA_SATIS_237 [Streptomyces phage Satis]QBZ72124.1 hypothetical protein SEA_KRADAL_238 [Streptomyces phage Kradal]QPL14545.1 hypothetical protein SEA_EHYELIMAYOE_240 [Streptomyces phage EhyElimayoE]